MEDKQANILERINVLYVDDELGNLTAFKAAFRRVFNVYIAESGVEAHQIMEKHDIEIVLTDQRMPEMTGVEFLESIITDFPDTIRILVTGFSDIEAIIDSVNRGRVYNYVAKPWNNEELKMIINQAYEVYYLKRENKELLKSLLQTNSQLEFMLRQKLLN